MIVAKNAGLTVTPRSKTAAVIAYTSAPSIIAGRGCVQGGIVVTAGSVVVAHAWFAWVPIRSGTIVPWLVIVEGKASLAVVSSCIMYALAH